MDGAGPARKVFPGRCSRVRALQSCFPSATEKRWGGGFLCVQTAWRTASSKGSLPSGTSKVAKDKVSEASSEVERVMVGGESHGVSTCQKEGPGSRLKRAKSRMTATRSLRVEARVCRTLLFFWVVVLGGGEEGVEVEGGMSKLP